MEVKHRLVTTGVAGGGCVVMSCEKKNVTSFHLEVFFTGLGGVLGSW